MKRLFAAIAAMMLVPTMASAGGEMISVTELREQVTALGRWQKTYSAYGRTITVDIQTIVPDVDRFPIVTCEELIQTEDEKGVLQNLEGVSIDEMKGAITATLHQPSKDHGDLRPWRNDEMTIDVESNVLCVKYNPDYRLMNYVPMDRLSTKIHYNYAWNANEQESYAENNPLTLEECSQLMNGILVKMFPQEEISFEWSMVNVLCRPKKTEDANRLELGENVDYAAKGSYQLIGNQLILGIPILYRCGAIYDLSQMKLDKAVKERLNGLKTNRLVLNMLDEDSYTALLCLKKPKKIEVEDVPLKPFDAIQKTIETEIQAGHIRDIYDLRLGYCVYLDHADQQTFWLYPCWKLECSYLEDAEAEKSTMGDDMYYGQQEFMDKVEFTTIIINAQNGELYQRDITKVSADLFDCPKIITWEDIQ